MVLLPPKVEGKRELPVRLAFWCLSPQVAFEEVASEAHSLLLTSGTLSPLDSFAAELGTAFPNRLEAPHAIDATRQVWAGAVSSSFAPGQLVLARAPPAQLSPAWPWPWTLTMAEGGLACTLDNSPPAHPSPNLASFATRAP